jgi:hypothetical protein
MHQFSIDALEGLIKYLSTNGTTNADPAVDLVRALQSQSWDDTSTQQFELSFHGSGDKYSCSSLAELDQLTCMNLCTDIILDIPGSDREMPQLGVSALMCRV